MGILDPEAQGLLRQSVADHRPAQLPVLGKGFRCETFAGGGPLQIVIFVAGPLFPIAIVERGLDARRRSGVGIHFGRHVQAVLARAFDHLQADRRQSSRRRW